MIRLGYVLIEKKGHFLKIDFPFLGGQNWYIG